MVGQGTYYKNIDDLLEIGEAEIQLMYVPFYCINHKTECEIGTGTRAFKDKYVASEHEEVIPEINERFTFAKPVMEVQAPADKYFYDAEKSLSEQNDYIKNCLFENYSLQVLFQFEFRKLNAVLDKKILEEKISNPKPLLDAEYQKFYDSKKETLLKLKDGKELINFVTEQTSTHNKDIASSFLCWAGIYGMKTSNPEYKCDYLFFDYSEHANQTSIKSFHNKTGKEIPW